MSEFDDLERQLRRSVRALSREATGPRPTRWRRSQRLLALVAIPVALAGGAAGATALVGGGPNAAQRAEHLADDAATAARLDPACHFRPGQSVHESPTRLVDGAIAPEILRAIPALRHAGPARDDRATLGLVSNVGPTTQVVRSSVREVRFPEGRLVLFVEVGPSFGVPDARRCSAARGREVLRSAARSGTSTDDPVVRRAVALAQRRPDTDPQLQTLWLQTFDVGGSGGSGVRVRPGHPLPRGITGWGGSAARRQYSGIAAAGATTIVVRPAPGSRSARSARLRRHVRRRIAVQAGCFLFTEPGDVGRLLVEHRDAAGRVLLRERAG